MADSPNPEANLTWKDIIAKYGAWTVLVFYLLGAIPFVQSPVDRITSGLKEAIAAHNIDMSAGQKETQAVLRDILQAIKEKK